MIETGLLLAKKVSVKKTNSFKCYGFEKAEPKPTTMAFSDCLVFPGEVLFTMLAVPCTAIIDLASSGLPYYLIY